MVASGFDKTKPSDLDKARFVFPWTGVGYTYDYYYQKNSWGQQSNNGRGPGEMVLLPKRTDLTPEMIKTTFNGENPWEYTVRDVNVNHLIETVFSKSILAKVNCTKIILWYVN